ncbi:phosphohistidine phosphatase SixA [Halothiobacillus diazotrophicus]|uniref:Phosphohistidine phosphatase SixA n=1 Tax=Halothiobacillus diazotrophicus TaxID=1860122 RepID=A0A191ZHR5_9GAMM|nr:phosphohistidine phosphatase SixA [Halothiobacillus diazotrophicus]ANJ67397.1 phosphohistidine phosphatase SixA [Halothiobacillus diazotrophicus]
MDLLIIRHAPAEDRDQFALTGLADDLRPLTERGIERMQLAARGVMTLALPIERLIVSPLTRAQQTAEILAPALEIRKFDTEAILSPEATIDSVIDWLRKQPRVDGMALVGHEPNLGQLAETLIHGRANGNMPLKKGSAMLIRFSDAIAAGQGQLIWFLPPGVLRALAD